MFFFIKRKNNAFLFPESNITSVLSYNIIKMYYIVYNMISIVRHIFFYKCDKKNSFFIVFDIELFFQVNENVQY
jgi:hypothetical protein